MAKLSQEARDELVGAVATRYQASSRKEKTRILDEFVRVTGYHRKHAIRVLQGRAGLAKPKARPRPVLYDEAVRQALIVLWEASDRICGKRLRALIPLLVTSLERHGHLQIEEPIREKVLRISASSIDRLLAPARQGPRSAARGRRLSGARSRSERSQIGMIRCRGSWILTSLRTVAAPFRGGTTTR